MRRSSKLFARARSKCTRISAKIAGALVLLCAMLISPSKVPPSVRGKKKKVARARTRGSPCGVFDPCRAAAALSPLAAGKRLRASTVYARRVHCSARAYIAIYTSAEDGERKLRAAQYTYIAHIYKYFQGRSLAGADLGTARANCRCVYIYRRSSEYTRWRKEPDDDDTIGIES